MLIQSFKMRRFKWYIEKNKGISLDCGAPKTSLFDKYFFGVIFASDSNEKENLTNGA
jgi:hypothetical protein